MSNIIYKYEDGVEEGTFGFDLFKFFPDSIVSIEVETFNNNYEINVTLDPFLISGKEISDIIKFINVETKQFFIEKNFWRLFIRYEIENNLQKKGELEKQIDDAKKRIAEMPE